MEFDFIMIAENNKSSLEKIKLDLYDDSILNINFSFLFISACLIATFGLLSNSNAVIIGAMIVAPLMMPLRGLAFGLLIKDSILTVESLKSLFIATFFSILISCIIGLIAHFPEFGTEVLARTQPNLIDLGIAVVAGAVSGFAKVRPKITDAVAGTAIAVALMPPLCTVGLTLSQGYFELSLGAFLLYITNFLGITFSCLSVFTISGYKPKKYSSNSFSWMLVLIFLIAIPLALSFIRLLNQIQIEASLKKVLLNRTITVGQNVELTKTKINWNKTPAEVILSVKTKVKITPKQVKLVENFIKDEIKKEFIIIFEVTPISEIKSSE